MKQVERVKNKTNIAVAVIVSLALLCIAFLAGLIAAFSQNRKDRVTLENIYSSKMYQLYDNLAGLEINLSKLMVSSSSAQSLGIVTDIYHQSEVAQDALTSLPIHNDMVADASKFLNQIADWSKAYRNQLAYGLEAKMLVELNESLYKTLKGINVEVQKFMQNVEEGGNILHFISPTPPRGTPSGEMKHNSVEYPELIYDGPFSDGERTKHYKALEGKELISQQQAEQILADKLQKNAADFTLIGTAEAVEPVYEFVLGNESFFSITVKGGLIVNFSTKREVSESIIGEDKATEIAEKFTSHLGYDVKTIWYNEVGGVAYVNLAPIVDEVVYYPDLIKVKIAMDNGEVLGLESSGFCKNNCVRSDQATISAKIAESVVSKKLTIINSRKAVIPLPTGEALTWEVAGEYNGLYYFVYVDAVKGETINILRVIDSNQGKMTI